MTTTSEVGAAAVPIGVGFTPFEDRLDVIDRVAVHAEWRGLAFVSVAEAMGPAAPLVLARLARKTQRMGLTTGVLSVWSRTPATLALTAAELQRQSSGRTIHDRCAPTPTVDTASGSLITPDPHDRQDASHPRQSAPGVLSLRLRSQIS